MYAVILDYIRPFDEIDAALAGDPFAVRSLATHSVYEFHPSKWADELDERLRERMS